MWYPATITTPAASEPVTLAQARIQCQMEPEDTDFDAVLTTAIKTVRAHVEQYCGTKLVTQTLTTKCDFFSDFARLPDGPVQSITSVAYVDVDGATQTLSTDVYELRSDDLEAAIVLKFNQSWPTIQPGSRITVVSVVGYSAVPDAELGAMLMKISELVENREPEASVEFTTFDALLSNRRRGI